MLERGSKAKIWLLHVLVGVPLAAFLHSVVQFAYDTTLGIADVGYFLFHFVLGIIVGSVVLVPAYTVQALLFLWMRSKDMRHVGIVVACGVLQALFVMVWWATVGLEPSLGGRFRMGPVMTVAGLVAGVVVAEIALARFRLRSGTAGPQGGP